MGFNSGFKGLIKLAFSRQISKKKNPKMKKIHKNTSSGSWFADGQAWRIWQSLSTIS